MAVTVYLIGEITAKTSVKASTIRFYEALGFPEPVERLENRYRLFNAHHVLQI